MSNELFSMFIQVRNEFEGYHRYPEASKIDERIEFLENTHRHIFKVTSKISVNHDDRELEFFLVKWSIKDFLEEQGSKMNHKSCEMISKDIISFLKEKYGNRYYEVTVSEDGESDAVVVLDLR